MKRLYFPAIIFLLLLSSMTGCGNGIPSDKDMMVAVADSFTNALYNFKYDKATALCDSNSCKAIDFFCSNLTEKDMEVIRKASQGASVEIGDADCNEDSTGSVVITASHVFCKDSIGKAGYIKEKEAYRLPLKKVNRHWKVLFAERTPLAE